VFGNRMELLGLIDVVHRSCDHGVGVRCIVGGLMSYGCRERRGLIE